MNKIPLSKLNPTIWHVTHEKNEHEFWFLIHDTKLHDRFRVGYGFSPVE